MRCGNGRVIEPEWMDESPPEAAAASLRDLVRINRKLGGHGLLLRLLAEVARHDENFSLLDVGAASGDSADLIRRHYPGATVTSLDYKLTHVRAAQAPKLVANAFQLPFENNSFDFVFCSLFLHHFTDERVIDLLGSFYRLAKRALLVSDLERNLLAYYFLPATRWLFGWASVTLHDGPISVEAAFRREELERLARAAGISGAKARAHRPAFRVSLVAPRVL